MISNIYCKSYLALWIRVNLVIQLYIFIYHQINRTEEHLVIPAIKLQNMW